MTRRLALIAIVCLLASPVGLAAATSRTVAVTGFLNGGLKVSASCTVSSTGQPLGTGKLTAANGSSYAFVINKISTGPGTVILGGYFVANNAPLTLTAAVPSGAQTLKYVVNGTTVTLTGTGTVTIQ